MMRIFFIRFWQSKKLELLISSRFCIRNKHIWCIGLVHEDLLYGPLIYLKVAEILPSVVDLDRMIECHGMSCLVFKNLIMLKVTLTLLIYRAEKAEMKSKKLMGFLTHMLIIPVYTYCCCFKEDMEIHKCDEKMRLVVLRRSIQLNWCVLSWSRANFVWFFFECIRICIRVDFVEIIFSVIQMRIGNLKSLFSI